MRLRFAQEAQLLLMRLAPGEVEVVHEQDSATRRIECDRDLLTYQHFIEYYCRMGAKHVWPF